ncbi:proline dehydrogenase [Vermiconidia calcicola]|uniref:Proline dehydrogenase n=1 Tax=Vermiconidia calcicola TaxID=1690605 RepID=A0ACC3NA71_9PEZI|nr:proline dehydrogenase [Vermiconidia calcicola]
MIGEGDWLGVKFTGAGQKVTNALMRQESPSPALGAAMDAICQKAKAQGCKLWIDAEHQNIQAGIDD